MVGRLENSPLTRALIIGASLVIIVAGLRAAAAIVVPFLVAVFVTIIVTPIFFWLQRRGLSSGVALLAMILALLLIGLVGAKIVQEAATAFLWSLSRYQDQYAVQMDELWKWAVGLGFAEPDQKITDLLDARAVLGYFGRLALTFREILTQATLIFVMVSFMLLEAATIPDKVRALPGLSEDTWQRMEQIVEETRHYISLKTVTSGLTGVVVWVFLMIFGVENAPFLGLLAFVLNYVPTIGSIIAGVPGVLIAFVQLGVGPALVTTIGYLAINFGISNGIEPRIMGHGLGLSPLVIIISMFFWGWVLGPIGMLLSVPLTMTAKIALETGEETHWIALLMASGSRIRAARRRKEPTGPRRRKAPRGPESEGR